MEFDFKNVVENLRDGLYVLDGERRIVYWNRWAEKISGYTSEEVLGLRCSDNLLIHVDAEGRNLCDKRCPMKRAIQKGASSETEMFLSHKKGHRVPVWVRTSPVRDGDGNIVGGVELFSDISGRELGENKVKELEKMALVDHLTRLSNRSHIESELQARLEEKKRYGLNFGVMFIDIDHFKRFNDTYGHDVGDTVLKTLAETIRSNGRPFDVFGRWGGEEFVGIVRNVEERNLEVVSNRLRMLVEKSHIPVEGRNLRATVSVGATVAGDTDTVETLLLRADKLMYESKKKGRNCVTVE